MGESSVTVEEGRLAGRAMLWRERRVSMAVSREVRDSMVMADAEVVLETDMASRCSRLKVPIESSSSPKVLR
jgi:hypothetical protein